MEMNSVNDTTPLWTVDDLTSKRIGKLLLNSEYITENDIIEGIEVGQRFRAGAMGIVHPLVLHYKNRSKPTCPQKLIFKRTRSDLKFHDREVRFYHEIMPKLPKGITPLCFGSRYCEQRKQYFLLLEDLSEKYECRLGKRFPPLKPKYVGMALDSFATLHASHWQSSLNGFNERVNNPVLKIQDTMLDLKKNYPYIRKRFGNFISTTEDRLYSRYFDSREEPLIARLENKNDFTLIHGDGHVGNLMFPMNHTNGKEKATLIDWNGFAIGPATWDLAYHLLWTDSECWTQQTSYDLLVRYHEGLMANGVKDYSLNQCEEDFRNALLDNLRIPISLVKPGLVEASETIPEYILRSHMAAMALIKSWDCLLLLK